MSKKTLDELDQYLATVEAELKLLQNKLGVDSNMDPEDLENIVLEEKDMNRLVEIFETINNTFSDIDLEDNEEETNQNN
jgi:hypothetical protein